MDDNSGTAAAREDMAIRTFVELVDSLVDDFDVIDALTLLSDRALQLLDARAAGVLLVDSDSRLRVVAASDDNATIIELFQLQEDEGPCLECVLTGELVLAHDLPSGPARWPRFAATATGLGYRSACAVPLRLRSEVLGCLNLFMSGPIGLDTADLALAQALGDVATIAMVQDRALRDAMVRQRQLQHALDSRIVIEQAKGMIAEQATVDMAAAFELLRAHGRRRNLKLTDVALDLLERRISVADLSEG